MMKARRAATRRIRMMTVVATNVVSETEEDRRLRELMFELFAVVATEKAFFDRVGFRYSRVGGTDGRSTCRECPRAVVRACMKRRFVDFSD